MGSFEEFEQKHGRPELCEKVSPQQRQAFAGKLPEVLLDAWSTSGWCRYADGLFWTVNPSEYADILPDWLKEPKHAYVYLRTAFGSMIFWDGRSNYFLDVHDKGVSRLFTGVEDVFNGTLCDDDYLDDVILRPTFREALPRLGQPAKDECYGFLPPLGMDGEFSADNLERVKLREHLAILAQL
ncbi:MAG TPA: GAD-like domain-containing protein [Pyrinomonadaceae bacterium]|jgi:hypothetical protein|nr:GAD-like domain-containing protein [Pyrinomonadaceae bacterium]